jgi:hypothetical protein
LEHDFSVPAHELPDESAEFFVLAEVDVERLLVGRYEELGVHVGLRVVFQAKETAEVARWKELAGVRTAIYAINGVGILFEQPTGGEIGEVSAAAIEDGFLRNKTFDLMDQLAH